jgi:hypothetical protein
MTIEDFTPLFQSTAAQREKLSIVAWLTPTEYQGHCRTLIEHIIANGHDDYIPTKTICDPNLLQYDVCPPHKILIIDKIALSPSWNRIPTPTLLHRMEENAHTTNSFVDRHGLQGALQARLPHHLFHRLGHAVARSGLTTPLHILAGRGDLTGLHADLLTENIWTTREKTFYVAQDATEKSRDGFTVAETALIRGHLHKVPTPLITRRTLRALETTSGCQVFLPKMILNGDYKHLRPVEFSHLLPTVLTFVEQGVHTLDDKPYVEIIDPSNDGAEEEEESLPAARMHFTSSWHRIDADEDLIAWMRALRDASTVEGHTSP